MKYLKGKEKFKTGKYKLGDKVRVVDGIGWHGQGNKKESLNQDVVGLEGIIVNIQTHSKFFFPYELSTRAGKYFAEDMLEPVIKPEVQRSFKQLRKKVENELKNQE